MAIEWTKLFKETSTFGVQTKTIPTKGYLTYEYNPFRNYRLTLNLYEYKGDYYNLGELWNLFGIGLKCSIKLEDGNYVITEKSDTSYGEQIVLVYSKGHELDRLKLELALQKASVLEWEGVPNNITEPLLRESGELVDFVTNELQFSLENPVTITPLYSYDGSVNLILNDGINVPRLINSRFSATGKNTYLVVDRKGNNDTNIYDQGNQFDIDTSLYKRVTRIPSIEFKGVSSGGNLKVGNYHFYFRLSDADGNETDFIGESGLVSVFIGFNDYYAIHTGLKNENSFKLVLFQISNIDPSYDYLTIYYTRSTAELSENYSTEYKKINKKYIVNNANICNAVITGYEDTIDVTAYDINFNYNIVDAVVTATTCLNMLFMGNVHKPDIPYEELSDLSLYFLPYLKLEQYEVDLDYNYSITSTNKGYIDPLYIYNNTGYWGKEIYRLGVVYILPNGELSPVFNIRGAYNIGEYSTEESLDSFTQCHLYDGTVRKYINYNEESFLLTDSKKQLENVKGVVSFNPTKDTNTIYAIDIRISNEAILELLKYVKGFFFVRLPRIPTILALGITIGIDKESGTPTIPTADGILTELSNYLDYTHVTTEDINDVNFISEGFLSRYKFKFKAKSSSLFSKIIKGMAIGVGVVALGAATVFTAGAVGAVVGGATLAGSIAAGSATLGTIAGTVGLGLGTVETVATVAGITSAAIGSTIATISTALVVVNAIGRTFTKKQLNGRKTKAPSGYKIVEEDTSRKLTLEFKDRIIIKDSTSNNITGILCPDYEVNLAFYNSIFTGSTHLIELTKSLGINALNGHSSNYFTNDERHFYIPSYYDLDTTTSYSLKILPVPDDTKCVGLDNYKFRSRAGEAEEAWRYECITDDFKSEFSKHNALEDDTTLSNKQINTDIVRGSFGAYLAVNKNRFKAAETVNIYIPNYSTTNMSSYFLLRMSDLTAFNAISDRYSIDSLNSYNNGNIVSTNEYIFNVHRGDCYLCQFTHRLNRNFNSPSAPYNDEIVDENTWRDHYKVNKIEEYENINLGDVNAILLGMWVTFRIRSSYNLNIRTLDGSNVDETQMTGHPRGFFPYYPMYVEGTYKTPESQVYNKGFSKSLSERYNNLLPDVPHIKNWFGTRIVYSDIHINDAFKNGYRVFRKTNEVDYTREYGEIVKLISLNSNLLIVFEHGIAIAPVNLLVMLQNTGLLITTYLVLPESPTIISDMYGSLWTDSIIKTSKGVYGVDTVAKKIWLTDGQSLECISDFKVQEFLNNNITLSERELTPKLGIRNVKTFYNAYKHDVLFTFYDNTYGYLEKVWNLCYNELLNKFITFYSWIPSYMENIDNVPFSFNRDTSKWIAKLGVSHSENSFADGITLSNNVFDTGEGSSNVIGTLSLSNRVLPDKNMKYSISYTLEPDIYGNYEKFNITNGELRINDNTNKVSLLSELYYRNKKGYCYSDDISNRIESSIEETITNNLPIFKNKEGKRLMLPKDKRINEDTIVKLLNIKATISIETSTDLNLSDAYYNKKATYEYGTYESTVAIIPKWNMQFLTTDFWKHGQAGIFDIADDIYPCYWYGKQHPFEFECIIVNDPSVHKIFTNLEIIANKAKPESFHYEVVGEAYDFAKDKPNMYFRQEAMKALWQYNGCDIEYNNNFTKVQTRLLPKSADLPHTYYARKKGINEVEDYYINATSTSKDYRHLSGGEIVYYPNRLEFRVCNHVMAVDINDLKDTSATSFGGRGLISSNMQYLEDRWKVQINPLLVVYKNEYERKDPSKALCIPENSTWPLAKNGISKLPPLPLYNSPIPNKVLEAGEIKIPGFTNPEDLTYNAFKDLYQITNGDEPFDTSNWLDDVDIYKYNFGSALNRKETDMRDKFIKVKIRYTGDELVVIDFLNTLYLVSYA